MKAVPLTARLRNVKKRNAVKHLREKGSVPAIIYGRAKEPQNLEVNRKTIEDIIYHSLSENILVDLKIEGGTGSNKLALLKEVQHHPLSGQILHIDFHEVAEDEKVTITVPVEHKGEPVGVKEGGILETVLFKLKVSALPKYLPEVINVDVSNLKIGQSIHIGDIQPPEGVTILGDKKAPVFAVVMPAAEAAAAEAAAATTAEGAAPAEPEVIREKKPTAEEQKQETKDTKEAKEKETKAAGAEKKK